MTDLKSLKDTIRRESRSRRKTAATGNPDASEQAARVFLNAIAVGPEDMVALYRAIQSELDPAPLVDALLERGISICFPVVKADETPLEFRQADHETVFVAGAFGAAIPEDGSPVVVPSVVVAPLLAWDRKMFRLGYGGGFYDRTLEGLRAAGAVRAFGYAYAAQEMDEVPIEATDQKLDGIVTEASLIT